MRRFINSTLFHALPAVLLIVVISVTVVILYYNVDFRLNTRHVQGQVGFFDIFMDVDAQVMKLIRSRHEDVIFLLTVPRMIFWIYGMIVMYRFWSSNFWLIVASFVGLTFSHGPLSIVYLGLFIVPLDVLAVIMCYVGFQASSALLEEKGKN